MSNRRRYLNLFILYLLTIYMCLSRHCLEFLCLFFSTLINCQINNALSFKMICNIHHKDKMKSICFYLFLMSYLENDF